jgi:hypothetical protein
MKVAMSVDGSAIGWAIDVMHSMSHRRSDAAPVKTHHTFIAGF